MHRQEKNCTEREGLEYDHMSWNLTSGHNTCEASDLLREEKYVVFLALNVYLGIHRVSTEYNFTQTNTKF